MHSWKVGESKQMASWQGWVTREKTKSTFIYNKRKKSGNNTEYNAVGLLLEGTREKFHNFWHDQNQQSEKEEMLYNPSSEVSQNSCAKEN